MRLGHGVGKLDCVVVVSQACCDLLRRWWCNARGRGAKLAVMWLSLQPPSGISVFVCLFSFLTLNRSSKIPGHRLPDHWKAFHFKQRSRHDVIACSVEEYKWAVCLEISLSILCQNPRRSLSTSLLIACQKTLKHSIMKNAPANSPPFYQTTYCLQNWNNPSDNIWTPLHPWTDYEQDSHTETSDTQPGHTHRKPDGENAHHFIF